MITQIIFESIAFIYIILLVIVFFLGAVADLNIQGLYILLSISKEDIEREFSRLWV